MAAGLFWPYQRWRIRLGHGPRWLVRLEEKGRGVGGKGRGGGCTSGQHKWTAWDTAALEIRGSKRQKIVLP